MLDVTDVTSVTDVTALREGVWEQRVIDDALSQLEMAEDEAVSDKVQLIRDCIYVVNQQSFYDFFENTVCPTTEGEHSNWGLYTELLKLPDAKWSTYKQAELS
jgi:hypothetical protein